MRAFEPNYQNLVDAAHNRMPKRLPLYDHSVDVSRLELALDKKFADLQWGDDADRLEFFRNYCEGFRVLGYDAVSFEGCIGPAMPDSGSLGGHKDGVIKDREDFEKYPWDEIFDRYWAMYDKHFQSLREAMPAGMKAYGGPGNGIFECVQDIVGYMDLCYIKADDEELYADLFKKVGEVNTKIWERFADEYADLYCIFRFGDDLGFKNATLLPATDIRELIIPQYARIVSIAHKHGRPFLLHSCGEIREVMDDIIDVAKIDAKHSNEDQIALFPEWVEQYGDRIGLFGGVDTNALCNPNLDEIQAYMDDLLAKVGDQPGVAIGCGNSIPAYVPFEGYCTMNRAVREYRGDYKD